MPSFHELSFKERYATLGDPAEKAFEATAPLGTADRLGWNRPKNSLRRMSPMLRNLPDYYTSTGHLVEVMGCGRDKQLKLKLHKAAALTSWNEVQPVALYVWNSYLAQWVVVEWDAMEELLERAKSAGVKQFHDGPKYVEISWADLLKASLEHGEYEPDAA